MQEARDVSWGMEETEMSRGVVRSLWWGARHEQGLGGWIEFEN